MIVLDSNYAHLCHMIWRDMSSPDKYVQNGAISEISYHYIAVDIRESVLISTSSAGYWSPGSSRSSSSSNGSPSQSACIGDMPRSLSSPISPCCTSTVTPGGEGKNFNQPKRKLVSDSDAETNENTTSKKRRNISEKSNGMDSKSSTCYFTSN